MTREEFDAMKEAFDLEIEKNEGWLDKFLADKKRRMEKRYHLLEEETMEEEDGGLA